MTQDPPYQVTDPATGKVVERFAHATDGEIEAALTDSASAYAGGASGRSLRGRRP